MTKDSFEKWKKHKGLFIPGEVKLGPTYSYLLLHNPRALLFMYARYKFAARLLGEEPKLNVLDLGCNEGLGAVLLAEKGHNVTAIDFDKEAIEWSKSNLAKQTGINFICDNFLGKEYSKFDAVVLLDVIEHVFKKNEEELFKTIVRNLKDSGFCIMGTPNVSATKYSSKTSKAGHVNLYSPERLRDVMRKYFNNVFLFGMNDEVVHTGFYPMCQYIICLGCGIRKRFMKSAKK